MPKLSTLMIVGVLLWFGWKKYDEQRAATSATAGADQAQPQHVFDGAAPRDEPSKFRCDGRTHCSQMTSCAEATYFIRNCPNTQMDGDNDGEPCESQWCD